MISQLIIKNVRLVNPNHALDTKQVDIFIKDGVIQKISEGITPEKECEILDGDGAYVSAGWVDTYSFLPDPGAEWKESLESAAKAFSKAGFTSAAVLAGVDPLPEKPGDIQSVINRSEPLEIQMMPWGLATEGRKGFEMSEIFAMKEAGAIGATDGMREHASDGLRVRMLQYCASLNIPYMIHPFNHHLVDSAMVHEGVVSVDLGMKGIPTASETSALLADIELAKWLNVPLRILGISSKESLEIVKKAKSDGVDIKCSVPIMNLLHDEHDLIDFDERFKVLPPLRSKADKEALKYGVLDGSIDAISTNHTPEDIESQKREFEYADFGADTLSGFGGMLLEIFGEINLPKAMQVLSSGNREFLSLPSVEVVEGAKADLTIYNPKQVENPAVSGSKAFNRLQISATVTGGVVATIRGGRVVH